MVSVTLLNLCIVRLSVQKRFFGVASSFSAALYVLRGFIE